MERGRADTGVERGNKEGFRRFGGSPNLVIRQENVVAVQVILKVLSFDWDHSGGIIPFDGIVNLARKHSGKPLDNGLTHSLVDGQVRDVDHLEPEIVGDVLVNQSEAPDSNHKQVCKWVEIGDEKTVPGCERREEDTSVKMGCIDTCLLYTSPSPRDS